MKRNLLIILSAILFVSFQSSAFAQGSSKDVKAITEIVDKYIATINDGDLDLVGKIWSHDDCVSFIGPQGRFEGYEQIRDNLVMGIKNGFAKRDLKKENLIVVVECKSALAECSWKFDAEARNGHKHTSRGRETQIFRKEKDGWKLVHIHYSAMRGR